MRRVFYHYIYWNHSFARPLRWGVQDERWYTNYLELKKYQEVHGHCNVPRSEKKYKALALWIKGQRAVKTKVPEWRMRLLEEIGFEWRRRAKYLTWEESYQKLKTFYQKHGHCQVKQTSQEGTQLGSWVQMQRNYYHKGLLTPAQINHLEQLEFDWKIKYQTTPWEVRYQQLIQFKSTYGHCKVFTNRKEYRQLAAWVIWQRKKKREGKLLPEREALLDEIGFFWKIDIWQDHYQDLKKFKKIHGHCRVPRFPKDTRWKSLGRWVMEQRARYRHNALSKSQLTKLSNIGFTWNVRVEMWQKSYQQLTEFYNRYGHCEVQKGRSSNNNLRVWVTNQQKNKANLSEAQITQLNDLGFKWDS